ncbi:MAG: dihydropteroate synthase [Chloroflexi bacterium]|nr:dihydropteroate synthase [Chloroflexota bacterium]
MPSVRVLSPDSAEALRLWLDQPGVRGAKRSLLARRAAGYWLGIDGMDGPTSRALQAEVHAVGGEAILAPRADQVDALLLMTPEQCASLVTRLRGGPRALARWGADIAAALRSAARPPLPLVLGGRHLDFSRRAYVDAVVNVTPDSFYDGGRHATVPAAVDYALRMVEQGADLLEIGGESAGPGKQVSAQEEVDRVAPVIEALVRRTDVPISIDTRRYEVARVAVEAGAHIVNDTQSLADPRMVQLAAERNVGLVLMHFPGRPGELPRRWRYHDLMAHMASFLWERADRARRAGVLRSRIIIDPGIGFHKTDAHDLEVLRRLPELKSLGYAIMLGTSNRGFLGWATGLPVGERVEATAATVAYGIAQGAHIVRVHNVKELARIVHMMAAVLTGRPSSAPNTDRAPALPVGRR